ncbi:PD-(D/E)XK nuclease family protein [Bacteroidales bacterium OttesenSCG-928-M06]|nr:PD-(D/E)XK nuclease family protein [Bacteroidales bacterium OttesenSCG-928-M06]
MNIFKTLASGSGSINEPNVSAFLGYLLNPKEDHGLGDTFLRRFLEPLLDKDKEDNNNNLSFLRGRNLSIHSNFEFEVLLEQAFKDINSKDDKEKGSTQIVDIVILCYEKKNQQGRFLAEEIIKQKKQGGHPKHIFLIENKIDDASCTEGQLRKQFNNTITTLKSLGIDAPERLVSVIYVTPDGTKCKEEFSKFKNDNNKIQSFWSKKNDNNSISKILREIIEKSTRPIDAYCKYTLQAFLEFIENDFKSAIVEELEEKKKRENTRFEYNEEIYSRPDLAVKAISDYIKKHEEINDRKITFDELKEKLFPKKKNWNKSNSPFVKENDAIEVTNNNKQSKNFYYRPELIPIEGGNIRVSAAWDDEKVLQELLDKTIKLNLNDMRIK